MTTVEWHTATHPDHIVTQFSDDYEAQEFAAGVDHDPEAALDRIEVVRS